MGGAKFITKELVGMTVLLVLVYLILLHASGFARSVTAVGSTWQGVTRTFQGR